MRPSPDTHLSRLHTRDAREIDRILRYRRGQYDWWVIGGIAVVKAMLIAAMVLLWRAG